MQLFIYREATDGPEILGRHDKTGFGCRPALPRELTPDRLARFLDSEEQEARGDLVGAYDGLRGMMVKMLGESAAGRILRELIDRGGFRGMARKAVVLSTMPLQKATSAAADPIREASGGQFGSKELYDFNETRANAATSPEGQ